MAGWYYSMEHCDYVWDDSPYVSTRKAGKIANDSSKHYPNKDEASLLRKIKSDTGLSEEEIRSHKKYRVMLSKAQKSGEEAKRTDIEKFWQNLIKHACQITGLVPQHPDTIEILDGLIEEGYERRSYWARKYDRLTAKKAIQRYGKGNTSNNNRKSRTPKN